MISKISKNTLINFVCSGILLVILSITGISIFNARSQAKENLVSAPGAIKLSPELTKKLNESIQKHDQTVNVAHTDLQADIVEVFLLAKQDRKQKDLKPLPDGTWEFVSKQKELTK